MSNQFKKLKFNEDFFEGFISFEEYILFGKTNWIFDMNSVQTNLLCVKKNDNKSLEEILSFYESRVNDDEAKFGLVTRCESKNYIILMTFTDYSFMSLHELVNLNNVIQILDDATSTNDCLRAMEYLEELKELQLSENEYQEIKEVLISHINEKGLQYIQNYNKEIIPQSIKKGMK